MRNFVLTLALIISAIAISSHIAAARNPTTDAVSPDELLVVFWNVENFFDPESPQRPKYWTRKRFYTKCDAIAKILLLISEQYGRHPDIIGLAEVENRRVLNALRSSTVLRKLGYEIVQFESADRRGIDCALLYRRERLSLRSSKPAHIYDSLAQLIPTRDILLAEFEELSVLVNHHPSKIGGKSERRQLAMKRMTQLADSLCQFSRMPVLAVGDFNEHLWDCGGIDIKGSRETGAAQGTIKFNGSWEKIDGYFAFGEIAVNESIFAHPLLLCEDRAFGGLKPRRSFVGPRYNAGISDHLPVVLVVTIH